MRDYPHVSSNIRPPKPPSRPKNASWRQRIKLFRGDMLSSQPDKLYRAKMAQMRLPFYTSYLVNTPEDARHVLAANTETFPKSSIVSAALRDLLGNSVFVSNGEDWARARRIIDPVFAGNSLKTTLPQIVAAGRACIDRLSHEDDVVEIEAETSKLAADVIFRVMFSRAITDRDAALVFDAFRAYQRSQPLWNIADLLRLPSWLPRFRSRKTRKAALRIRGLLAAIIDARLAQCKPWPDDLLTGLILGEDPQTGYQFDREALVDQVAIFFLAGHETSASALAWGLYLLALDPQSQDDVAQEGRGFNGEMASLSSLGFTRDVFRETLRLYPPVPMMLRDAGRPFDLRGRTVKRGSLIVLSPWHLGRHEAQWQNPDEFDPSRWQRPQNKAAFIPFSAGPRVCAGAGFAMAEGVSLLAMLTARFELSPCAEKPPIPVAHLTLRARDGIWLKLKPRA